MNNNWVLKSHRIKSKTVFFIALVISLFIGFDSQAQTGNPLIYTDIVKVDSSLTSKDLYFRARSWFAETFKSAQAVIQMDDKENGKIIGKGNIKYESSIFFGSNGTRGWISYTISVQVKDGRYKYEITDFIHEGNSFNSQGAFSFGLITDAAECPYRVARNTARGWRNKVWNDIKVTISQEAPVIQQSLIAAMGKPPVNKDSDW